MVFCHCDGAVVGQRGVLELRVGWWQLRAAGSSIGWGAHATCGGILRPFFAQMFVEDGRKESAMEKE